MFGLDTVKRVILGVVGFVIMALVIAVLWYRSDAIEQEAAKKAAEAQVIAAASVNKTNLDTIAKLQAQKKADDDLVNSLSQTVTAISDNSDKLRADISDLQRQNHEVSTYLSAPVPPDLARLLSGSKTGSDPNAVRKIAPAHGANRAVQKGEPAHR